MPKKRGAPKGNLNARKHGFYSRAYTREEGRELSQTVTDYRQNNIKFFKVLIARTSEKIKPSASNPMTFQENILALQTLVIAIKRLHHAVNRKSRIASGVEKDEIAESIERLKLWGLTKEEIDLELFGSSPVQSGGKRGGQSGNLNAFKHGFYAAHYTAEELEQLDDLGEDSVIEEITLLLVLMKRVFIGLNSDIPLTDYLRGVRALSQADVCLENVKRTSGLSLNARIDAEIKEAMNLIREEMGIN
jgi:hypothetical protein